MQRMQYGSDSMKLSIIVPVYNAQATLDKCLDSLLEQDIQNYEVICVDDGSTDSSFEILSNYKIKYSHLSVYKKNNGGQASARNLALSHALGDFISFVDSDDWIEKNMYRLILTTMEKEESDIGVCDMVEHFSSKDVYHSFCANHSPFAQAGSACNKVFRRSCLNGLTFPLSLWYEDFNFTTKILLRTNTISYIPKGLYHYRFCENSTMHNQNSLRNLDMIKIFEDILCYSKEHNLYAEHYHDLAYLFLDHVYITTINRVALHKTKEKKQVIQTLAMFGKENFPNLFSLPFYQELPKNKAIIAKLNSNAHWRISKFLLALRNITK